MACTCVQANKLCVDCRPGEILRCVNKALASSQPCRSVSPVPMASHAASQPTESMRDSPSLPLTALAPASSRPYLENSAIDDLLMSCRNPDRTQRHPDRTQRHSRTHRHDPPPAPTRAQSEDAHLAGGTVAAESQSEDAHIAGGTVAAESQDPSSETEDVETGVEVSPTDAELLASLADSPSMAHPAVSDQDEGIPPTDAELLASLADSQSMAQPVVDVNVDDGSRAVRSLLTPSAKQDLFTQQVMAAYEIVVGWRRNLFIVPHGAAGASFVDELAGLIEGFAEASDVRNIAWRAVAVACHLLLQKPHNSKLMNNHADHLRRRLCLWRDGMLPELVSECSSIQNHLPLRGRGTAADGEEKSDVTFSNLVFTGQLQSAMRYLQPDSSSGVLSLTDVVDPATGKTVHDVLLEKHPAAVDAPSHCLLPGDPQTINPIMFQRITPELIKRLSRQMHGSSGPSGLDADAWTRLLTSYKASSDRLCSALAAAARCICTESIDKEAMDGFTSARLIPLDKRPGVRPIAVGEVHRRLICRAVASVVESDVMKVVAPTQTCVGIPSACETSVHIMCDLLAKNEIEGVLLVDASNAFNSLNRQAALHNVARLCPALQGVIGNTYSHAIRLFVSSGGELASVEGTCQGDPLAMALYAVAIAPMIQRLQEACPTVLQSWYADDDSVGDTLESLAQYWKRLLQIGPAYGYFPNANKTILVTKAEHLQRAKDLFGDTGMAITSEGSRYLGGHLGTPVSRARYTANLVESWMTELRQLIAMARTQPQAAYTVFCKCVTGRWTYHLRCLEFEPACLMPIDTIIRTELIPALTGHEVPDDSPLRELLSLPARFGGLALPVLSAAAVAEHQASLEVTRPLVCLSVPMPAVTDDDGGDGSADGDGQPDVGGVAVGGGVCAVDPLVAAVGQVRSNARQRRRDKAAAFKAQIQELRPRLSAPQQLLVEIAGEKGVSSWITTAPSTKLTASILTKSDFRDGIAIRYGLPLDGISDVCVCGAMMSIDHAFTCPCGGYTIARHNELRDILADAIAEVVKDVDTEPMLLPYEGENLPGRSAIRAQEARLDIRARGFWSRQQDAFFDVRVTHPKATVLSRSEVLSQLKHHEQMKKRQYCARVNRIDRGTFTPLVFSTSCVCGPEANIFFKSLAAQLCEKHKDIRYSQAMGHLRSRLSFSLIRWAVTCFRGSRSSYKRYAGLTIAQACRQLL